MPPKQDSPGFFKLPISPENEYYHRCCWIRFLTPPTGRGGAGRYRQTNMLSAFHFQLEMVQGIFLWANRKKTGFLGVGNPLVSLSFVKIPRIALRPTWRENPFSQSKAPRELSGGRRHGNQPSRRKTTASSCLGRRLSTQGKRFARQHERFARQHGRANFSSRLGPIRKTVLSGAAQHVG
jgi:hypothetical protein